ncbi:MAG: hypothetical protein LW865_14580 [Betaproteobacteria bacterium]|nr:hypothetical protein [Betaproteobacteria bacterium]
MSGAVSDRINGLDTLLAAIQKLMRAMGLNTLADYFEGLSNAEALAMIADARKSTVARTESAMQPAMSRDRVYNNSREDLSNFNRYDAANDKPSQALRDAIKKFERETPGFQIDPLGNSRVIVTRLKKDDLVSSLKTLKEFGDTNNVAVGISSKTASYTDFSESSGFRAYIQRADDEIGGRVSYERDSNHFARIVGVYAPRSLKGEVRFSRKPSVNTLLKKYGYAPKYDFEVVRALNAGDRIFAFNEQDEKPIEITSVTSKEGIDEYPLDRLLILDKMAGVPDAPVLSRAPQTDTPAFREFVRQFVANQPIDKYTYDRELKDLKEEIINQGAVF